MKKILLVITMTLSNAYSMWIEFAQGCRTYAQPGHVCIINDSNNCYRINVPIRDFLEEYDVRYYKLLNDNTAIFIYNVDQSIVEVYKKYNAIVYLFDSVFCIDAKRYYKKAEITL